MPSGLSMGARKRSAASPVVAALLSLVLVVGLSDVFNGVWGKGARLLAPSIAAFLGTTIVGMFFYPFLVTLIPLIVGFRLFGAARAALDAHRLRDVPRPARTGRDCIVFLLVGGAIALLVDMAVRTLAVQAYRIPSNSMLPTLGIGDNVFVDKLVYGVRLDIPFTKATLGRLPVEVRDRRVIVDGKPWDDPHGRWTGSATPPRISSFGPYTVPTRSNRPVHGTPPSTVRMAPVV